MTPQDFQYAVELARREAGLDIRADKGFFVDARLAPLARREGLASVDALVTRLRDGDEPALRRATAEALASPETCFFRDRQVFERLRSQVLPALSERRGGRPLRVWCAGCGTGQEVYSLALTLEQGDGPRPKVEIYASDLSERALQKARSGLFTHFEVQRGLPIRLLLGHFEKVDDLWRVSSRLRQGVRWAQVNLAADLKGMGPFDVVLCRNVLSGFTREAAEAAMARLEGVLAPDGCLVLGLNERLTPPAAFSGEGGVLMRDPGFRREAA